MDGPDYLVANRAAWAVRASSDQPDLGRRLWAEEEPSWGIWNVAESDVQLLPQLDGRDALELGCGTAYVSAWLARRGARPIGLDPTSEQLGVARQLQVEFDLYFPLVCAPAEAVPLADQSFDLAISEYGASIWSDPYLWIPEVARVLRPGGELIFLVNGTLLMLCVPDYEGTPAGDRLRRDYFGMHRFEWPDSEEVDFHLGYGDWIRLLRRNGFEIDDLVELKPRADAIARFDFVTVDWARRWPSEEVWKVRKRT